MSKKSLGRTLFEPGKREYDAYSKHRVHSRRRVCMRTFNAVGDWEESPEEPQYIKDRKMGQADRLSAMYKWLDKHVGQAWNDIFSELREKFPVKGLTGFHLSGKWQMSRRNAGHLWDYLHFCPNWDPADPTTCSRPVSAYTPPTRVDDRHQGQYFVDGEGILRKGPARHREKYSWGLEDWAKKKLVEELKGKRAIPRGRKVVVLSCIKCTKYHDENHTVTFVLNQEEDPKRPGRTKPKKVTHEPMWVFVRNLKPEEKTTYWALTKEQREEMKRGG